MFPYTSAVHGKRLYWAGNAAKFGIANEIRERAMATSETLVIVDLGAGLGGDWHKLSEDCSNLEIHLWEPHSPTANVLKNTRSSSRIFIHENVEELENIADIGTSLSVLEHVQEKREHLKLARKVLKKTGHFYMNFDDGHFRPESQNIFRISNYRLPLAEAWRTFLSGLSPRIIAVNKFQRRVVFEDFLKAVDESDLVIDTIRYNHLSGLKSLVGFINVTDLKLEYMTSLLNFEAQIQDIFKKDGSTDVERLLWEIFPTRTAILAPNTVSGLSNLEQSFT